MSLENKNITIKVSFTGLIDVKNFNSDSNLSVKSKSTINDVLGVLGIRPQHKRFIITLINDNKERLTYILKDGDHLSLFLPVGGG
ncbi:MAG TPA: MoaD/ThiS family protein [Victivallales bacterium]|nr:MoaD/ThiS family protein [Victivallales bacterium]